MMAGEALTLDTQQAPDHNLCTNTASVSTDRCAIRAGPCDSLLRTDCVSNSKK